MEGLGILAARLKGRALSTSGNLPRGMEMVRLLQEEAMVAIKTTEETVQTLGGIIKLYQEKIQVYKSSGRLPSKILTFM